MPPFNEKGPTPMSVGSLNDAKTLNFARDATGSRPTSAVSSPINN